MYTRRYTFDGQPIYLLGECASQSYRKIEIQDFYTLRQQHLDSKTLFEDPEFPATSESLFYSKNPDKQYKWLRPTEICKKPRFFVDRYSRFDAQQGELGNCWFTAAVATLAEKERLFTRVVYDDNGYTKNYAGIFHFCFWRFGKWIDVVIDDRLPTYQDRLIFMRSSQKNEFWSALLEKAYAKLHGNYELLNDGITSEALEDFTGGISERFDLNQAPDNFFNIIERRMARCSMMACSIDVLNEKEEKTPQGLVRGHAYSITKVQVVHKTPLLRLRNPWGNDIEWNGPWSDKSSEWCLIPDNEKQKIGLTFEHDGEFWMSFKDFLKYFDHLEICNLTPDSIVADEVAESKNNMKWNMHAFYGEWVPGLSAGGCRNYQDSFYHNPQYIIKLEDPDKDDNIDKCTVLVSLMQKHRRMKRIAGLNFLPIGFEFYRVNEKDLNQKPLKTKFFKGNPDVISTPTFSNSREVNQRFELKPGYYLIVPSTFEPDLEGEFLIRVFSESKHLFVENDETVRMDAVDSRISNTQHTTQERLSVEKLFLDIADSSQEIGWKSLKLVLDHAFHKEAEIEGFSNDICRSMVAMLDVDHSGKLGLEEFRTLLTEIAKWKAVFKLYDKDSTNSLDTYQLRDALSSAGYRLNNHILSTLLYRYGSESNTMTITDFIMCAVKVRTMMVIFKEKDVGNINQISFTLDEWIAEALYT